MTTKDLEPIGTHLLPDCVRRADEEEIRPTSTFVDEEAERLSMCLEVSDQEIANYLKTKIISSSDDGGLPPLRLRFDSAVIPLISIEKYLKRLELFCCSRECLLLALIYLDRLNLLQSSNNPRFRISRVNIHRLLLIALTVAVKYFDDIYYTNEYYAKIGGIPTAELVYLEIYFLHLIEYDLYVSPTDYVHYLHILKGNMASRMAVVPYDVPSSVQYAQALNWAKAVIDQEDCSTDDGVEDEPRKNVASA